MREEEEKVCEVYKKIEIITNVIILKQLDLNPPEQKIESTLWFLEDSTHILTMERWPLALESSKEALECWEKEEKKKVVEIVTWYTKLLSIVKAAGKIAEATYDNFTDRYRVTRILVATHEVDLKEFQEKNKGNKVEQDKIIVEVEKNP